MVETPSFLRKKKRGLGLAFYLDQINDIHGNVRHQLSILFLQLRLL